MASKSVESLGCYIMVLIGIGAVCVVGWIWQSSIEAEVFNKATGSTMTTWDAMFLELRVQAPPEVKKQAE